MKPRYMKYRSILVLWCSLSWPIFIILGQSQCLALNTCSYNVPVCTWYAYIHIYVIKTWMRIHLCYWSCLWLIHEVTSPWVIGCVFSVVVIWKRDSNFAEAFMNVRSQIDGNKAVHRGQRTLGNTDAMQQYWGIIMGYDELVTFQITSTR